jgi:hypothetical protein
VNETAITVTLGLVILIGLAGTLVPWFPDILLIWGAGLGYGLLIGWGPLGPWLLGAMTVLGIAALAADVVMGSAGARLGGASGWGLAAGFVCALIGLLVAPPLGAVVGFALGVLLVESLRRRDARQGLRASAGAVIGWGASFVVKFLLALAMATAWGVWVALG